MKLNDYFLDLVQQDLKHKEEILDLLEDKHIKL
ncbi:hypothetical protein BG07_4995 [Bacillus pseudomycoides]|nr:hypothetical protein DJ92_5313 [Bacillus pseudomycoides]AJI15828.1 hypothetical protein BG07_4995 [Bacillus pseudomycoides]